MGAGNQVTIIPDRNTNSLVVTAPVYLYPNIRSVIAQLDVKQKAKGGTRVIALKFASAEEMAQTLQGITKRGYNKMWCAYGRGGDQANR